ncbi:unnamed protein product [Chironomus riparius]|uniref:C2H2-type domain-containing protein n=1 Tax=Chironomus riparius TaxID=315576 RepID=A0A9N9RIW0_9DIPT|nr:unnamed protein product [Chironomus riparius]
MTLPSPFASQNPVSSIPTQNKQQQNKFQPKNSQNSQFQQHSGQQHSQFHQNSNKEHPAQRNFISFCKYCQEGFSNDTELFQHRRSHAKCPYDDCKFNANDATIAIHIQKVHLKQSGLVKIQDLSTPEQIEKWREERRKRYPTTQNVIMRQQIQEERQKRGERLNESKKRFGDGQQKDFVQNLGKRQHDNKKNHNNRPNRNNDRCQKFQKRSENEKSEVKDPVTTEIKPVEDIKPKRTENFKHPALPQAVKKQKVSNEGSSDEEETQLTPKFQGTCKMKDYHTVESSVKEKPALSLLGMYGSDSEDENSNGSDMEVGSSVKEAVNLENQNLEAVNVENLSLQPQIDSPQATDSVEIDENEAECPDNEEEPQEVNDNDSGPEELPTVKEIEADEPSTSTNLHQRTRKRKRNDEKKEPKKIIRRSGIDYSKLRNRSINPFLEKLLERDIVHERNILLQCVNFVVNNNFFGIVQSTEKSGTDVISENN